VIASSNVLGVDIVIGCGLGYDLGDIQNLAQAASNIGLFK
jgi:hypothetical protein